MVGTSPTMTNNGPRAHVSSSLGGLLRKLGERQGWTRCWAGVRCVCMVRRLCMEWFTEFLGGCGTFGRTYGVSTTHRRMLKAIAASKTWALALTRPT